MKRVLVTGASGFVGKHLVEYLLNYNLEIWGTTRVPHINLIVNPRVHWITLQLLNSSQTRQALKQIQPDYVFHLAGQSNVRDSWSHKVITFESNLIGTIHLLESVQESYPEAMVITVGSSEEYGMVSEEQIPISEDVPPNPKSPYGVSKLAISYLVKQYVQTYGMRVIHARPFNHIGPGQDLGFVTTDFAKQIVSIELGLEENPILVGNLDAARDFTDVRDIVRAYWLLAERGSEGEIYNVCSGEGIKISTLVEELSARSKKKIDIVQDPSKIRPLDVPLYMGDNAKIMNDTGWSPKIPLSKTLDDIMEDWRYRLSK